MFSISNGANVTPAHLGEASAFAWAYSQGVWSIGSARRKSIVSRRLKLGAATEYHRIFDLSSAVEAVQSVRDRRFDMNSRKSYPQSPSKIGDPAN